MVTGLADLMSNESSILKTWVLTVSHEARTERSRKGKEELIWPVPKQKQMFLPNLVHGPKNLLLDKASFMDVLTMQLHRDSH